MKTEFNYRQLNRLLRSIGYVERKQPKHKGPGVPICYNREYRSKKPNTCSVLFCKRSLDSPVDLRTLSQIKKTLLKNGLPNWQFEGLLDEFAESRNYSIVSNPVGRRRGLFVLEFLTKEQAVRHLDNAKRHFGGKVTTQNGRLCWIPNPAKKSAVKVLTMHKETSTIVEEFRFWELAEQLASKESQE